MSEFLQFVFDGLSEGAIYSLFALSLVVTFRATSHLNFAAGEMAMFAAFVVWQSIAWGVPLWGAVAIGVAFGFVTGGIIERALIRPVERRSTYAVLVVMVVLFLMIDAVADGLWGGGDPEIMPSLFPNEPGDFVRVLGAYWRWRSLGILVVALTIAVLLLLLFKYTRFGLAMRAVASNPSSAPLVGINTSAVLTLSWALSGALAAVAAVLVASSAGEITITLMFNVFVYAAAAACLGGFDSLKGAILGGLSIGVVENLVAGYAEDWVGNQMKLGVALTVIILVLLVKPAGLFGSTKVVRV